MSESQPPRPPLAGLLVAQFFGAFNDQAMKLMVALLAGGVAVSQLVDGDTEMARQEQTTLAFVIFTLPLMLFSLPSALLADRVSKRNILIAMKVVEVLIMAAGATVLWFNPDGGVWLMVVLGFMGLQSAVFSPAKYGIMPQLCDESTISKGNGLLELWTFLALIGGFVVGGGLLEQTKPDVYLAMGALALLAVVGLAASFFVPRVPAVAAGSTENPLSGAWKAIRSSRTLTLVIAGQMAFWSLASLIGQDVLTYAKEVLELSDTMTGATYAMFGIGIGIGSVAAGRISNHRIEPGLIPLGAIGLALGTTLLGALAPGAGLTFVLMGVIGVAAGVMVVPLEAMLQWYSPADKRGAVIAIANVPIFFGVMAGSLIVYLCGPILGYSSQAILAIAGFLTIAGTIWALWLLPSALLRMFIVIVTNTFYRLRVEGREHLPEEGGALIVANHVALTDAVFLIVSSNRPIRFLVESEYYHRWTLRPFMKMLGAIPITATDPKQLMRAMKQAGEYLAAGELVCIFAEGEISRTGVMLPFRRGLTRILKGHDVPVIPAHLDQVWGSVFSAKGGGFFRGWNGPIPRPITLSFAAPMSADSSVESIRKQVKLLDERAWHLRQEKRSPLHHTLARTCRRGRFKLAISDTTGARVSRIKLLCASILTARKLRDTWAGQDHVGIMLPPTVGSAVVNFAAAFAGKVSVNLNYTTGRSGLESAAQQAGLQTVVTSRSFLEKAGVELPPGLQPVWVDEIASTATTSERFGAMVRALLWPIPWLEKFAGAERQITNQDLATVIFSSGSTGEPKGVMLSHSNLDANAQAVAQVLNPERNDRILGILPQFHSFGYMVMWFAVNEGVPLICHTNPADAATIGPLVQQEGVTMMIATPTFLQLYMRRCSPGQFGALRLVLTGSEKLKPSTADGFEEKFGIRPIEGFGATECAPAVAMAAVPYRARGFFQSGARRGTIGQALPGVAVKIVDPDSFESRPTGESGLLLVRGPNVMVGYLGREDLTAKVMHDGWYDTGDIAVVDEDGYIRITDRLSRFSKIGGEMVPHGRIEEELHDACECCDEQVFAVTGIPDEKKGERLAVVYTIDEERLPKILAKMGEKGLPNLFIPKVDQFTKVDEIPVLGTGKTDLKRVKQMAMEAFAKPG